MTNGEEHFQKEKDYDLKLDSTQAHSQATHAVYPFRIILLTASHLGLYAGSRTVELANESQSMG